MELAIAGLVTAEGATRLWTRDGTCDVVVDRPRELRSLLGSGRVDREAMLPHGARTDMAVLDVPGRTLILAAPFQPPQEPQPLCEPMRIGPQRTRSDWTPATYDWLAEWLGDSLSIAWQRDEAMQLVERTAEGDGERRVSGFFVRDEEEWCFHMRTNAPGPQGSVWDDATPSDGAHQLRFVVRDGYVPLLAKFMMSTVRSWPGGPLDLLAAWTPMSEVPVAGASGTSGKRAARGRTRGAHIEAVHMPWQGHEPISVVTLDRRDVTRWYGYVSGGPMERVLIHFDRLADHHVYTNSRYASMDPQRVNDRATALLHFCGVGLYLNEVRGDVLVVGDGDDSGYPTSIDEDLVYMLSSDD